MNIYRKEALSIDRFMCSWLDFVFTDPFGPTSQIHKHEHGSDDPVKGNRVHIGHCVGDIIKFVRRFS